MRDIRGHVVDKQGKPKPDKTHDADTAPETEKAGDKLNNPDKRKDPKAFDKHAEMLQEHHDRLSTLEAALGLARKANEMKSEDQGGKVGKESAGHVTEKAGAHYGRKRH